ncbi:MAG TPA: succinylglutamate-semialdehyde dehydrogenase [Tepidisphaeraceae bacterium]
MSSEFQSIDPASGEIVWRGSAATPAEIDRAVSDARGAFDSWATLLVEDRAKYLRAFAEQLGKRHEEFTEAICRETGKPRWEAATETDSMIGKIAATIEAHNQRRTPTTRQISGTTAATRYKPHGVIAVLGPFNFPAHLPNGHIMPALLAGNTIVFKPSELTPLVAEKTVQLWQAAGLPSGVLNLVQGGRDVGETLVNHPGIDGVFFTGSFEAGRAINRALAEKPGKILALEMGGNNPLIVHDVNDLDAAAYWTIQSAYITAGQRCSCARRLIVSGEKFVDRLAEMIQKIIVGRYTDSPQPFMGPVISDAAAKKLLAAQDDLQQRGGRGVIEMKSLGPRAAMLWPGLIDVTEIKNRADEEIFGPLLQLIRVNNFDDAIHEANRTRFGLSAGLFSDDHFAWEKFSRLSRAGVVNWNRPLTGASGLLPFGGVGCSGNNRPSAYFAADYCSYPIASMEIPSLVLPERLTPGIRVRQ